MRPLYGEDSKKRFLESVINVLQNIKHDTNIYQRGIISWKGNSKVVFTLQRQIN